MMMFDIPAHPTDKFWCSIILWWDKAIESLKNVEFLSVAILHHVKGVERKEPTKSSEMSEEEQSLM